ncbi:carbohydrate ABC transporter permease [Nonomuraea sp. NPDC050547]|uniref:carbohydrate ABC transporter permease n=1 Tax=unclassified Nonomuraea TaxID=2593643 RepID=UPI00346AC01E
MVVDTLVETRAEDRQAERAARKNQGSPLDRSRRRLLAPFIMPSLVIYLLVMIAPTVFTVWISFNKWAGVGPMEFVGLQNYTRMFKDPVFHTSFVNTFLIVFGVGAGVFLLSFVLTMLLQDMVGRKFVRAVIFFPTLIPGVVISILWGFMYDPDGLVNAGLRAIGFGSVPEWLSSDNAFKTIMLGMVWLSSGGYTVIFMAATDRIPRYYYEVADLDGASAFQRFRYVTLPLMWDVVGVCMVLWMIGALKVFEFLLTFSGATGQLPSTKIWNFSLYSYATAFPSEGEAGFGMAAACAVLMLVLTVGLTLLARHATQRRDDVDY